MERLRPPGLPLRTMLCGLCRREDVAEVDMTLALGCRVRDASAESQRRHRESHLWAWLLDFGNAGRARAVVADIADGLAGDAAAGAVTIEALTALARVDKHLYPQHVALVQQRQEALGRESLDAARRLLEYGTVDGYTAPEAVKVVNAAASQIASRLGWMGGVQGGQR